MATAFVLSGSGLVNAEKPESRTEVITPPLELYDTDEDGYVSPEEAANQKNAGQSIRKSGYRPGWAVEQG